MSRMVRDSLTSGLRERHWFARVMFRDLHKGLAEQRPRGELLALRGAVLLHLYSALLGLSREGARSAGLAVTEEAMTGLRALLRLDPEQSSPELALIAAALSDHSDPLYWLDQEVARACAASGLASRPQAPREENTLAVALEDPNQVLAEGDLARLSASIDRVQQVLEQAAALTQEW